MAATVLFTEEDRSALESEITDIDLELLQLSTEPVDVRVFPVTMDEFKNSYASSMNIAPADQRAIDAIADPAECKKFRFNEKKNLFVECKEPRFNAHGTQHLPDS